MPRGRKRKLDLVGQRFGRLVVTAFDGPGYLNRSAWRCLCDCGTEVVVLGNKLRTGHTTSCGCRQRTVNLVHGQGRRDVEATGTYKSWRAMMARCGTTGAPATRWHGARGVVVCERWMTFENFRDDMGERPPGTTLDRSPDRNGNYEPGNCRWATAVEQTRNRDVTKLNDVAVALIRHMHRRGSSFHQLGHAFGVAHTTIYNVVHHKTWRVAA